MHTSQACSQAHKHTDNREAKYRAEGGRGGGAERQGRAGQGGGREEQGTNLSGSSGCHTLLNCSRGRTSDSGTKPQLFRVMNRPPPAMVSWGAFSCSFPAVFFSWLRKLPSLTTLLMLLSTPSGAALSRRFCCCLIFCQTEPTPARQAENCQCVACRTAYVTDSMKERM